MNMSDKIYPILMNVTFSGNCKQHHSKRLFFAMRNLGIIVGSCEDWRLLQIHKSAYDSVILEILNVSLNSELDHAVIIGNAKLVELTITHLSRLKTRIDYNSSAGYLQII